MSQTKATANSKKKQTPKKKPATKKKSPVKRKAAPKKKAPVKTGRPTKYTKALGEKICLRLASGESLNSIAKDPKMPARSTIVLWAIDEKHEFSDKYARARQVQAECLADDLFDIADDGSNDYMEKNAADGSTYEVLNAEHVQRSRLRVDTRKWYLSRIVPRFKDKKEVEHTGTVDLDHRLSQAIKRRDEQS